MEYEIVNLPEKVIAGIAKRTKNSNPDMMEVVGGLWKDFYEKGIYESIPDKLGGKAICGYSDYESDVSGEYTVTVGSQVSKTESLPDSIAILKVPASKYAKFEIQGNVQTIVGEFWMEFWKMNLERAYQFDFEEYQDSSMENATIHMYISIR